MSECKGCGSPTKNCGAPIWEDVCTNKDCTYDADQFKLQMRKHGERMRKAKALRDAAPELYEALVHCENMLMRYSIDRINHEDIENEALTIIRKALSKARSEHK